ncbi:MAG: hypothetical protein PVG14_17530 [Anaerolineales bacterium]|jgi:hypothetical protein
MLAEKLYRMLLLLYPRKHRKAYARLMLQHARDLSRDAQERGRWQSVVISLRLLKDAFVNAGIEQLEAFMMANNNFKSAPWFIVLLASIPGLLVALSRRNIAHLNLLLPILGYSYLGLLVIGLPIIWWRRRRFPVWALLPAGALVWILTYRAGTGLAEFVNSLRVLDLKWMRVWTAITIIDFVLAATIFLILLRGQRIPRSIWLILGIMIFGNALLAIFYSFFEYGAVQLKPGVFQYFTEVGIGPVEGLMLVAVGLLAARQHGVLAVLVVVGGYFYMVTDSDYLSGFRLREWTGLSAYIIGATIIILVAVPVALLRAKSRLGRALAVFVPLVAFHVVRLAVPSLVLQQPLDMLSGEMIYSINILLSLILAWLLYSHIGDAARVGQPRSTQRS